MKRKLIIAISAIVLLLSLSLCVFASDATAPNANISEIKSVTLIREKDSYRLDVAAAVTDSHLTVIENSNDSNIYLFELFPYQKTTHLNELIPVASAKASSNPSLSFTFDVNSQSVFARYLIAYKTSETNYAIISDVRYIDNPELLASNTAPYPAAFSKKGLAVQMISDAQQLGVAHTVINVPINDYILTAKSSNSLQYTYAGNTYYIDRDKLGYLDYRIKNLTQSGVHCYINFILSAPAATMSDGLDCLYYTSNSSSGASLFAIDATNRDSALYLESFATFIAKRYTDPSAKYGFAGSFIVGYQINSNRSYNYMGESEVGQYVDNYIASFRIFDTALRSAYSSGRTYISLAGNFNTVALDTSATIFSEKLDYTSRNILDEFAKRLAKNGDLPWRVMINLRPSDVISTDFRADAFATDTFDTQYLSVKNVNVLCDYLGSSHLLYNGEKRPVTVSFGINSADESVSMQMQAAMYALAYYKLEFINDIEASIYYRHVDNSGENGHYGLWTESEATPRYPAAKKPIYELFEKIDTDNSLKASEFALDILGIEKWEDAVPHFNSSALQKRKAVRNAGKMGDELKGFKNGTVIVDFSQNSLSGFEPNDNIEYFEFRNNGDYGQMLYIKGHYTYDSEYMGISVVFDEPMSVKNSAKISFSAELRTPNPNVLGDVMLRLFRYAENGKPMTVYEGSISGITPYQLTEIGFDISAFVKASDTVDGIKIWFRPTADTAEEGEYAMYLNSITMYPPNNYFLTAVGWLLLVVLFLAALLALYIVIVTIVKKIRRKRRRQLNAQQRRRNAGMPNYETSLDIQMGRRHRNMPGTTPRE